MGLSSPGHGTETSEETAAEKPISKAEELVLKYRLVRHLVGLNVRKNTVFRCLGLARLIRGLVR
jgi:hypothetical protein